MKQLSVVELLVVTIQSVALEGRPEVAKLTLLDSKAPVLLARNFALTTDTLFFSCLAVV